MSCGTRNYTSHTKHSSPILWILWVITIFNFFGISKNISDSKAFERGFLSWALKLLQFFTFFGTPCRSYESLSKLGALTVCLKGPAGLAGACKFKIEEILLIRLRFFLWINSTVRKPLFRTFYERYNSNRISIFLRTATDCLYGRFQHTRYVDINI